jgi:RNAse (barnase) inhibitor barstar
MGIKQHGVEIDVGRISSREELHRLLSNTFHFPEYYGNNWDAFDECIRDVEVPSIIQIKGIERLRSHLPREAELLSKCFQDFAQESNNPKIKVSID